MKVGPNPMISVALGLAIVAMLLAGFSNDRVEFEVVSCGGERE